MEERLTIPLAMAAAVGPEEAWPLLDLLRRSAATGHRPIATTYARLALAWHCSKAEARTRLAVLVDAGVVRTEVRRRGKRIEGLTLRVWRPDPAAQPAPPPKRRRAPASPQRTEPATRGPKLPEWVKGTRVPAGETRRGLAQAVTDIANAIAYPDGPPKRRTPWASKTDASPILSLFRAQDDTLTDFVAAMRQIARWARESDDGQAAQDIRGEGRERGVDRSCSIATLCVQRRYSERRRLAQRWHVAQQPRQAATRPAPLPVRRPR